MSKVIHIWITDDYKKQNINPYHTYNGTRLAIKEAMFIDEDIHTTQLFPCSTQNLARGFRIFVHFLNGTCSEIKLGENQTTPRTIRMGHNLEKLLLNNEFGIVEKYDIT